MAGWRVGMLGGREDLIQDVLRFKSNMDSGMFFPVQMAAVQALSLDESWYLELKQIYRVRREKVFELLRVLDCTFQEDQSGMFVWAKIPESYPNGYQLSDQLLLKGRVFLTPGGIFGSNGEKYIRVSLCKDVKVFEEAILRIRNNIHPAIK